MMQPLMYCTVSETPSSPSPPIGPVPTSAQPKEEGASSTGEEPPSVYWMALVLCVCVCVFGLGWVWVVYVCGGLCINMVSYKEKTYIRPIQFIATQFTEKKVTYLCVVRLLLGFIV